MYEHILNLRCKSNGPTGLLTLVTTYLNLFLHVERYGYLENTSNVEYDAHPALYIFNWEGPQCII